MKRKDRKSGSLPKVAILGPPGVGKTVLGTRLTGNDVPDKLPTHTLRTGGVHTRPLFEGTEAESLLLEGDIHQIRDGDRELEEHEFSAALVVTGPLKDGAPSFFTPTVEWLRSKTNRLPFKRFIIVNRLNAEERSDEERWEAIAKEYGFDGVYRPNALTGDDIEELRKAILDAVQWQRDQEPEIWAEVDIAVRIMAETLCELVAKNPHALDRIEWRTLEQVMASALRELGFWVELTPPAKDGGKDIIARCTLGKEQKVYYVEIKHWMSNRPGCGEITEFIGVNSVAKTDGGLFLSSSGYTDTARARVGEIMRQKVRLGGRNKIVTLCQQFVQRRKGVWTPDSPLPELLLEETLNDEQETQNRR